MNSIILSLTILLTLAVSSDGFVCTANFCDGVRCAAVTEENCSGRIVKNGSTCRCCDSCVTILEPGASCFALLLAAGGPAPTVACPDNYSCDFTSRTCQPNAK